VPQKELASNLVIAGRHTVVLGGRADFAKAALERQAGVNRTDAACPSYKVHNLKSMCDRLG